MPGAAVETMSMAPEEARRLEMRLIPWSSRYSISASSEVSARARTSAAPWCPPPLDSTTSS